MDAAKILPVIEICKKAVVYGWNIGLSVVCAAIMVLCILYLVKTINPILQKKKAAEPVKGGGLSKKNRNKRFTEKKTNTIQRQKLSKNGICYRFGDYDLSPARYDFVMRPVFGLITMVFYLLIDQRLSLMVPVMFFAGYIGIPLFLNWLGKRDEQQIEWDIYKALTNIRLQLACGAYLEDCLHMIADSAIHPRFREAMDELLKNMNNKSLTTADAIKIFESRFSSERMMAFCKILENFITYGSIDGIFDDMNKELDDMIVTSSDRSLSDIRHRYQFVSGWMGMIIFILLLMYFNLLFSDHAVINKGVIQLIQSINTTSGGKIF